MASSVLMMSHAVPSLDFVAQRQNTADRAVKQHLGPVTTAAALPPTRNRRQVLLLPQVVVVVAVEVSEVFQDLRLGQSHMEVS